jgi:putative peptidoglycan lipid II flippase
LLRAILTIGSLSMLAKGAVLARDLILASHFGAGDALDAYLIAYSIPLFAINVLNEALSVALVPAFVRVLERDGAPAAQRLLSKVIGCNAVLLITIALVLAAVSQPLLHLLAPGFSPAKLALTRRLFLALLPTLVMSGMSASWVGVLQARRRFAVTSLAPAMTMLLPVAFVLALSQRLGVAAVVLGSVAGFAAEATVLGIVLVRAGFSGLPRLSRPDAEVLGVLEQYAPIAAGSIAMWSTTLIDQAMASQLGPGNVSLLSYGNRLISFAVGLGSLSVSTAVLPHFSKQVARGDWRALRQTLRTYLPPILLLSVVATGVIVGLSRPIVRTIFERGSFTAANTVAVAQIQALYALQIPFFLGSTMLVRLISALRANQILMWGSIGNVIVDVTANYLFMRWIGVRGIALSTSLVYALSFAYKVWFARWLLRRAVEPMGHPIGAAETASAP